MFMDTPKGKSFRELQTLAADRENWKDMKENTE